MIMGDNMIIINIYTGADPAGFARRTGAGLRAKRAKRKVIWFLYKKSSPEKSPMVSHAVRIFPGLDATGRYPYGHMNIIARCCAERQDFGTIIACMKEK